MRANNRYDRALGERRIASGTVDLVAFVGLFISNPDLVERMRDGASLQPCDEDTFDSGDRPGYTKADGRAA